MYGGIFLPSLVRKLIFVDLSDLYVDLSDNFVVISMALTGQEHFLKIYFLSNE